MGESQSQEPAGAKATGARNATATRARGGARRLPFALLVVLTAICVWWTHGHLDAPARWTTDALLRAEDRFAQDRRYLVLTHEVAGEEEALRATSLTLDRDRPGLRVPIAAPPGEIGAWLDAHALYLLPIESHQALAARFEDEAMTRAVQELRAQLSSPFFGLMKEDARRDPLGVRPLLAPFLGASERPFASGARVTSTGDLVSADGRRLLVELRTDAELPALEKELRELLKSHLEDEKLPVGLELIDPRQPEAPVPPYAPFVPLAAAALVAFGAERRLLRPILRVGIAAAACVAATLFAPTGAPFEFPYYCALLGCAYWLSGARSIESYAPTIFGLSLVPLVASVYPGWGPWASAWAFGCLAAVGLGLAARKWLVDGADADDEDGPTPSGTAAVGIAAFLVLAATVAGSFFIQQLHFAGTQTLGDEARRTRMGERFFDPAMVVRSRSWDESQVRALARSAEDHQALRVAADELGVRLDGPGTYLLSQKRLEARRKSLRELRLRARMQVLRNLLETEGFRPEAFSEFLDTSARLDELPDAQAALDGNLGPWIASRSYAEEGSDRTEIESLMYFQEVVRPPAISDSRGEPLTLHGPAVAAAEDAVVARSHLIIAIAISSWLASVLSFVARRHFLSSLLVGCVGFAAAAAGLGALYFEGVAPSAELFVPLLVVMTLGQAETEASIEAISVGTRPRLSALLGRSGPLLGVAALCLAAPDPITHQWGLILAVGTTLGAFVAHVLSPILASALTFPPKTEVES